MLEGILHEDLDPVLIRKIMDNMEKEKNLNTKPKCNCISFFSLHTVCLHHNVTHQPTQFCALIFLRANFALKIYI